MNLPRVQREDDNSLWSLCPVQDIDKISLLYCGLYLRQLKESLKQTMLDQESIFEDQIHELHRLYRRQKDLMMEMGETNDLCSVLPPKEAAAKIDEAGISGDESDKVFDLELPSYSHLGIGEQEEEEEEEGSNNEVTKFPKDQSPRRLSLESVVQGNVQHLTSLSRSKCILDLNEPAKIEDHSDSELNNQFPSPVQRRSERAEPETQDRPLSTTSLAENGINLNMCPPLSSEEVTIFKKIKPREFLAVSSHGRHRSGPAREIVQALPCSKGISLFHKRSSRPRKKGKRGAKSTTVETFPRSKARKCSNLDSSFGVNENDNHSLSTASHIPESDHYQEHLARNWTNTRKRRQCKPRIESGKVMRKNAITKTMTRGSFLVTEEEDEKKSAAADAIVDMSLSDFETSDCIITPLHWFAKIASSVVEDSKSEVGLSVTGFHSDYRLLRTPRSQGKRQLQHEENLPSVSTFTGNEATQDLEKIERLIEASEMIDDHSSLMENTVIDWGTKRKRKRGIRVPATNTKNSIAFLQLPF